MDEIQANREFEESPSAILKELRKTLRVPEMHRITEWARIVIEAHDAQKHMLEMLYKDKVTFVCEQLDVQDYDFVKSVLIAGDRFERHRLELHRVVDIPSHPDL